VDFFKQIEVFSFCLTRPKIPRASPVISGESSAALATRIELSANMFIASPFLTDLIAHFNRKIAFYKTKF